MSNFRVCGIQKGTSKKGKPYCILHLMQAFENPEYGEGSRVSQEFLNDDVDISGIKPGMDVSLTYNKGFDGKAYISTITPVVRK